MTGVYVTCGECDIRIDLVDMKDFESFSTKEAFEHYEECHPVKLTHDGPRVVGMPYLPVQFDD